MATPLTGGTLPATQQNNQRPVGLQGMFPTTASPFANRDYSQMVQSSLETFMDPNSELVRRARQSGIDYANTRGGINSSIAAGAAEGAALEQALPLAQTAVAAQLRQEDVQLQDWVNTQGFNRELNSMPYQNSLSMLNQITQASIQDPQLYTPSVVSGFSNFFEKNMQDILSRYFGNANGA